ncbi:MAG: TlpA disulfide reductase family protein [Bacteroidota bacterium]|nr:TlpA family protein disulfide reductase [Rhodothermia bacterium]MCS7154204.1 TlpA family protein disulfide reductase [Bacteroidota bacterium]MDW8136960.1 TlpA disulfide reductase family protein [Bacteroidota bacterium]MDW8285169.1 TlpA disulfide reductase family protein [Bacteroidota bacterium]
MRSYWLLLPILIAACGRPRISPVIEGRFVGALPGQAFDVTLVRFDPDRQDLDTLAQTRTDTTQHHFRMALRGLAPDRYVLLFSYGPALVANTWVILKRDETVRLEIRVPEFTVRAVGSPENEAWQQLMGLVALAQQSLSQKTQTDTTGGMELKQEALAQRRAFLSFAQEHARLEAARDARLYAVMVLYPALPDSFLEVARRELDPNHPSYGAALENVRLVLTERKPPREALAYWKSLRERVAKARYTASKAAVEYHLASLYAGAGQLDSARGVLRGLVERYPQTRWAKTAQDILYELDFLTEGAQAPDFTATDIEGRSVSLRQFRGKVVLLDFWATWCQPCLEELPNVKALWRRYRDRGFVIIGVSLDEDVRAWKRFVREQQLDWVHIGDGSGWRHALVQQYRVQAIPATFLLDRQGKIIARNLRGPDLERAVAQALEGS